MTLLRDRERDRDTKWDSDLGGRFQKVHSGFLITASENPQWAFWPT